MNTQSGHWYWAAPVARVVENITGKLNPLTIAIHSWLFAVSQECLYTESSDYICSYMTVCSLLKMRIKLERFSCMKRMSMFSVMWQWINEDYAQLVADPGFSPGGCANSQNCYYFSNFCQKLHENERIWTPRGVARPWRPPLDPPMPVRAGLCTACEKTTISL